ncbi:ABC transporter ATP-binding protein [Belliella kenyensis]|uniref:ABC transporter ATP-binding protein n=1 Tax=Belliella kenyensis TaxID=1472724 RepID=A0ABV8ERD6_9BACT|nr:ATP-binding cassette domain-containing protein [Belliella kenyensis]MCH7402798.1 ATP-binding cassette domain-containing protein [Belliella kenyensis]MDN3602504.1 ATP-binding cassette domain-containing protein [Belliella kenyensis]
MSILSIHQLYKYFGEHIALEDINLEVPRGMILGILGPNGAGKTTLIRIINQILKQDRGEVKFQNERLHRSHIFNIGYLPEERGLYKKMTVQDQLIYFARIKGVPYKDAQLKVDFWLEKLSVGAWRDKKIEELSKGMAQKIQFIATVIHEPKLLILDEPFSGFDPVNAALIRDEILELKERGVTIMLSTHRMDSVEQLCDHVALINKSKLLLHGAIEEVKERFDDKIFEVKLQASSFDFPISWQVVEKSDLLTLRISQSDYHSNDILSQVMRFGEVRSFGFLRPSMEEIFIKQVKASDHG